MNRGSTAYGHEAFGDPALYWQQTPFAGTPEAASFAERSQCVDLVLPEPEDYGGTDGAPAEPPAEPTGACDAAVHQGGNAHESHTIELGTTSGMTTLFINTFEVADSIDVYYEDQLIAQSGCLGTAYTIADCLSSGWCCNGELCGIDLSFDGASSQMHVEVSPNCDGSGDTQWEFTLTCPI